MEMLTFEQQIELGMIKVIEPPILDEAFLKEIDDLKAQWEKEQAMCGNTFEQSIGE